MTGLFSLLGVGRLSTAAVSLVAFAAASGNSSCSKQHTPGSGGAGPDPAKEEAGKPVADVTLAGVDTSALTTREKRDWSSYVSEFLSPCADTPVPIAQCVQEKRNCAKCVPAAKLLVKGVRDGLPREDVDKLYKARFDPAQVKNVPVEGSPFRGPESAPITVVEFADFECPHCAAIAPRLQKLVADRRGDVRVVYKFFPLQSHNHGELAARGAYAAMKQGKFWEMDEKLFTNQMHLEQGDIEGYAKDLELDLAKFRADMASAGATEKIGADKKLGDALGLEGTPTLYVNGRKFDGHIDLDEWIDGELQFLGKAPGAAPSAAPSASSLSGTAGAKGTASAGSSAGAKNAPPSDRH